ncbi:MAG: hypothetical protein UZ08_BCD001000765 [Candidatus Parvibacillus calidus]|nr:MAG: hypothetical protein UZ08_BCD001000765 [Candidatus Parvibacillus calidus]
MARPNSMINGANVILLKLYIREGSHVSGLGIVPPDIKIYPNNITPMPINIHLKLSFPNTRLPLSTCLIDVSFLSVDS